MRVELQVFSGRRDPAWELSMEQEGALMQMLVALPRTNDLEPVPFHLGYRGLVACGSGVVLRVYRGHVVVAREGSEEKHLRDEERSVENFLLTTGAPRIPGGVLINIIDQERK